MKKLQKSLLLSIVLIITLALSSCFLLPNEDEVLQPPLRAPDRIDYRTVEVTRGTITDEVRGTGTVVTKVGATVSFRDVTGRLKALHASSGQDVEEGDLLAELHNDDLVEALNRQEKYTRLAEIDYELIRRTLWGLQREAAEIRLSLAQMDLERAREAVEKTLVYAPTSGRIVYTTFLKIDEYIDSFVPIYNIADLTQLSLRISDDLANRVPLGATVSTTMDNVTHYGTVVQVPSMNPGDSADRNIAVIDSPTLTIEQARLGRSFPVIYERARAEDVIVIDRTLVRTNVGRTYVIVLVDNIPVERNVILGITNHSQAEILEGLREGELVVQ